MPSSKLPANFRKYFWEIDTDTLDVKKRSHYVIERLLEQGNMKSIQWLLNQFGKNQLIGILRQSRKISPKTANFWSLVYDIPKEEIKCLDESYQKQHKHIWPH